jgi:hypothetical protein
MIATTASVPFEDVIKPNPSDGDEFSHHIDALKNRQRKLS